MSTPHFNDPFDCTDCSLLQNDLFRVLNKTQATQLNLLKHCQSFKKGDSLFEEESWPKGVYAIHQGKVKIFRTGSDGKGQIVEIATAGDLVGFRTLISEEKFKVSAEALEEVKACFIPKDDFLGLVNDNLSLHRALLKSACKELGEYTESMTILAQKSVRERTATTLLMLSQIYRKGAEEVVEINLSREDLANIVGTAKESLIRQLHDLKEEGLITSSGRIIRVLSPTGLNKAAHL